MFPEKALGSTATLTKKKKVELKNECMNERMSLL